MKEKNKEVLKKSAIVFVICFILMFCYSMYESSLVNSDISSKIFYNIEISLLWNTQLLIVIIPVVAVVDRIKIKNSFKILIVLGIVYIIAIIYILANLKIYF